MTEVTLTQLKQLKDKNSFNPKATKPEDKLTTMFMPMNTNGTSILEIKTRQSFLDHSITLWREWKIYKVMALGLALVTIYLFFVNIWFATAAGAASGWCFAQYVAKELQIARQLRNRDLYELG